MSRIVTPLLPPPGWVDVEPEVDPFPPKPAPRVEVEPPSPPAPVDPLAPTIHLARPIGVCDVQLECSPRVLRFNATTSVIGIWKTLEGVSYSYNLDRITCALCKVKRDERLDRIAERNGRRGLW